MRLDTIPFIWQAFQTAVGSVLTIDRIFYIGIGFSLLMVLFLFIKSFLSYEVKLERKVNHLNEWLLRNQTITEANLIEFNNLIKDRKAPKILRKHWQQYMLYRDKLPSEYMSAYNCIDKPAKTSSFTSNIKNLTSILRVAAAVTFLFGLIAFAGQTDVFTYVSQALITPVTILIISLVFTLILRSMQNYNLASLYQTFHIFNRYIDKASATIPKYVDFEILFTKKEIKEGIPILGEYLEKRARQEQEELDEAQRNAVSHEEYDFSASGVDGSLVLERAMKESETYLNAKQRLLAEIQQFESEISTLKKNYENTSKDYQRKLQASKENMERLRQQQEESTNRIEVNYIRKQQQDEVRKQEQLEKDQDDATNKFNTEVNSLTEEIEKRRIDIEERRVKVQTVMESEYQTFSNKLFTAISDDVKKESEDNIQRLTSEKEQYTQAIVYLKGEVDNKDEIIKAKDETIAELQNRLGDMAAINEAQQQAYNAATQTAEEEPSEDGHYDDRGYYWYNDKTYYDADGLYHDLEGNVYDGDGNLVASGQEVETEATGQSGEEPETGEVEPAQEEQQTQEEQPVEEEQPEDDVQSGQEALETTKEQPEEIPTEEPVEEAKDEPAVEEQPKRKVGRPRKEKPEEEQPKRKVGRPRKEVSEEEKPKRKVGRPRKEESVVKKEKHKVGRPKGAASKRKLVREVKSED